MAMPPTLKAAARAVMIAVWFVVMALPAMAQLTPTSENAEAAPSGLEALVKEAREEGSTVVIIRPQEETAAPGMTDNMRAERFLQARERVGRFLRQFPTLLPALARTLEAASPDDTYWWILRAIGTALLGLLIATFLTGRSFRWLEKNTSLVNPPEPKSRADRVRYLLVRTIMAVFLVAMALVSAFVVAVVLDSGHEPTRRLIYEIIMANAVYRFLRHGISWNFFAGSMPKFRLVNLTDQQALTLHRDFHISALVAVLVAGLIRFFAFTSREEVMRGVEGVLRPEQVALLQIIMGVVITLLLLFIIVKNWRALSQMLAPSKVGVPFARARANLAKLVPLVFAIYAVVALVSYVLRVEVMTPPPGAVLFAPAVVGYMAILIYGVILILIQSYYNRREWKFRERYEAEKVRHAQDITVKDEETGEEMVVNTVAMPEFEYQPVFRSFFENGALAIVAVFALGELARFWGFEVGRDGHPWTAFLDIFLAATLCWLAYRAVSIFIDRRLEEEGGVPVEEELGGDGGGAGATRMATLLPIMRYVMTITIFSVAGMIILSRMGFDIAPIFAGAGVVGIAVGFGAQTLIRDIFSGAFFLMDDAFRRGEYVEIEGIKGTVEKISVRSFQLRHHLGALHTIPFGEIKQLTNYSRDWVLMKLPLRVTYDTDVEKVRKLVKKLGQALLDHPQVGHTFMQPLKSQGVYRMEDSAMIIRVKFMTKPGEQFVTRKVVYESIQDLFAREGIHFAHKEVTVRLADRGKDELTEEEKKAVTAAARSVIDQEEEAAQAAAGGKAGGDGGR
ncbi:MAG: mechanosensitive ion channel domain-containing protein [Pseudomonadota bacterium]